MIKQLKQNIKKILININKDKLTDKTLNTYTNILSNLYNYFNSDITDFEPYFFIDEFRGIIQYLLNNIDNKYTRKTIISAILNILRYYNDDNDMKLDNVKKIYSKIMYDDNNNIELEKQNNMKNKKENNNWINYDDIINKFKELYLKYYDYFKINNINNYLIDELQNLIILSFYIFLEPRRLEYVDLKYKNYDINNDNYIDIKNKIICLNNYKTYKKKGQICFKIKNKIFLDLINKFIKLKYDNNIKTDYLFNGLNYNKLQPSQLTIRLNKIFNKKISASMIRKSFLTNIFSDDLEKFKKLEEITKNMGNSSFEAIRTYIKK